MSTNHTPVSTLFASEHPHITTRVNAGRIAMCCVLAVIGISCLVGTTFLDDPSSALAMFLLVAGVACLSVALFQSLWRLRQKVFVPTNSVIVERSLFFSMKDLPLLTDLVQQGAIPAEKNDLCCVSSGSVRLDMLYSKDRAFLALQLFEFVPYTYSPVTSVVYYHGLESGTILTFLYTL